MQDFSFIYFMTICLFLTKSHSGVGVDSAENGISKLGSISWQHLCTWEIHGNDSYPLSHVLN